jgi:hypothetical protein
MDVSLFLSVLRMNHLYRPTYLFKSEVLFFHEIGFVQKSENSPLVELEWSPLNGSLSGSIEA